MDAAGVSSALSSAGVATGVDLAMLKAVQNLDQAVAAQLAASIGLGTAVDAYA